MAELTATIHATLPKGYNYDKETLSITIPYNIITSQNTTPDAIRSLTGFPEYGTRCPIASGLICTSVSVETKSGRHFIATATFSNAGSGSTSTQGDPEKPWNDPPVVEPVEDRKTVVLERAFADETAAGGTGDPSIAILNPAGDLFDNPPQLEQVDTGVRISWAKQTFTSSLLDYLHTVNSAAMTINGTAYPAQTLFLASLSVWLRQTPRGTDYYTFSAEIKYSADKHRFRPLLCGWKAVDYLDSTAKKVYINADGEFTFDPAEGEAITEPVLLNSTGNLLADTQNAMRAAAPVYGDFIVHRIKDWTNLAIPSVRATKRSAGGA